MSRAAPMPSRSMRRLTHKENDMDSSIRLDGRHVVVLGGTSGIGRAVAHAAQAAGARVTVLGRNTEIPCDVTDANSVDRAFEHTGSIDHLVLTTGARVGSPRLDQLTDAELALTYEVKLFGSLRAIRAALPVLAPQASITLTSGLLARKPSAGGLLKGSVNAALEAAARQLAKELAPRRVNVVSPGVIETALWATTPRAAQPSHASARDCLWAVSAGPTNWRRSICWPRGPAS